MEIIDNERVSVTSEVIGEATYPLTVVKNKKTGHRRALVPLDGTLDVQIGRELFINDVQWFGHWRVYTDPVYEDSILSIDLEGE